ncbi:MAG TPA: flagellar motor switch protein FliN [Verrucomicrobia bacterium]|nr:MAG: flagellar motor switch protein FliN [Lentisphaerae bacterium GWF2_57_35]HBA84885.1 flagellar motor switch protein FliN [Verrucomicrobiota bacterium]
MEEPNDKKPGEAQNPTPQDIADQELAELYKQMEKEAQGAAAVVASPIELPQVEAIPQAPADPKAKDMNLSMILDIPVDVHVELGQTQISIQDILRLGVGSIIELDRLAGSSADIVVNGKLVGQGDVVVINENFGVRISKLVDPQKRIESL